MWLNIDSLCLMVGKAVAREAMWGQGVIMA